MKTFALLVALFALQYEGASTLETSFMILGQVAGQELFSSPEVAAAEE